MTQKKQVLQDLQVLLLIFNCQTPVTDDNCDVVLNMGEVTDAKRAQVEDIVQRKTNISADKIVITPIVVKEE